MSDPKCRGPHDEGAVYQAWQHTSECKDALKPRVMRQGRFTEVKKDFEPSRHEGFD